MAAANGYVTEREIVSAARERVRADGLAHASQTDQTIVVIGYLADTVRASMCPVLRDGKCPFVAEGHGGSSRWLHVLERAGPWTAISLFLVWLIVRTVGLDLSGLLG